MVAEVSPMKLCSDVMPQDLTDDKSTLVQAMAWCHQATSHYLSQCWPRSLSPYGVTRPQWVNSSAIYLLKWAEPVIANMTPVVGDPLDHKLRPPGHLTSVVLSTWKLAYYYTLRMSVRLSVRPASRELQALQLCSPCSSRWIHFIFLHLIKHL